MTEPAGFSWVEQPKLAGLARPWSLDELHWLRQQGIDVLISLIETPLRRDWINDAGLMVVHEPVPDMTAPTLEQLQRCLSVIENAHQQNMGVAVHCAAGQGRTGTVLAAYLVTKNHSAQDAIDTIRSLRPGSIETSDQVQILHALENHLKS